MRWIIWEANYQSSQTKPSLKGIQTFLKNTNIWTTQKTPSKTTTWWSESMNAQMMKRNLKNRETNKQKWIMRNRNNKPKYKLNKTRIKTARSNLTTLWNSISWMVLSTLLYWMSWKRNKNRLLKCSSDTWLIKMTLKVTLILMSETNSFLLM